ncbi:CoA-binding protein [Ponticoccus sp. SC2-23]|uniref:CoA-binding protein n=1 Tax=Alexandriicola marinus TaxID=2081710 RepID=UPI000FD6E301|nr:CoA-binding protein [Alexandriicola marinus]MBM1220838.1 CoA-binding protein [Ponticoccus sp. SC6-9]MBM1225408.1 CoA-binding protein [Ponticoccus sp. SC6-15]MBM1227591.1 CoA-binding protein [Ponticoccus sp. SC6-38]MBM1234771.1 CoA-binding protein [Ponticoccus sp. SC6-45]MBM1238093.1 CoA-binding protein [Ponticoccus sp. SC6-49]MBM1244274.1 CoA-binding protein [Ponticoccus sp. SC2-64]MBM1248295.1 CoA-binding protein [Ponticoccus sp. SC6-42]MBM1252493.1 CoA-binding protein [Ponticoccus sp. 
MKPSDAILRAVFDRTRTIALVGASPDPLRASYFVGRYLTQRGYRVIGVNPKAAGQVLFGETVRASLSEIEAEIDMVDIFRRSEAVPPIVEEALSLWPGLGTVWMQIGVRNAEAADMARARDVTVIEDLCPKQEYQRLAGELRMGGFATGRISSKLPGRF